MHIELGLNLALASALAVALSIIATHYLRCIHPPGGATALTAVIGGASIHTLGFQYLLTPVLLNALVLVMVAVAFNYPFVWRRYPAALSVSLMRSRASTTAPPVSDSERLSDNDIDYALQAMNSTIDIDSQDLRRIYELAQQRHLHQNIKANELQPGQYYSNGEYGSEWQVRHIIDMPGSFQSADDL